MTMVVSEISDLGIVMVGDSAVTRRMPDGTKVALHDAAKLQYSERAKVGFALWGNAVVPTKQQTTMDRWLADFINASVREGQRLEEIGALVCQELNPLLERTGKKWEFLNRGIHLAGYQDGLPRLCHIHCGKFRRDDTAHELRFHPDPSDSDRRKWKEEHPSTPFPPFHFRNGLHRLFSHLSWRIDEYAKAIETDPDLGIRFPMDTLESRLEYHKLLVTFIAGVFTVSGEHPSVNSRLSAVAFDKSGLRVDQRLNISPTTTGGHFDFEIEY